MAVWSGVILCLFWFVCRHVNCMCCSAVCSGLTFSAITSNVFFSVCHTLINRVSRRASAEKLNPNTSDSTHIHKPWKPFHIRGSVWQLQLLNIYIMCVHMCPSLPTCLLVSHLLFIMQWLCVHAWVPNVCLVMSVCWATVVIHIHLNSSCMVDAKQLWFENSQLP